MSEQTADTLSQKTPSEFRGSLVRTVIISLVLIALLPATIIGATSYIQFRNTLHSQTINQISSLSQSYSFEIEQLNSTTQSSMQALVSSVTIQSALAAAQGNSYYFLNNNTISNYLQTTINSLAASNGVFAIYAVNSDGRVILSSNTQQIGTKLTSEKAIQALYGTNKSALVLNPDGQYVAQLVIATAYTKQYSGFTSPITFIYYAKPALLSTVLKNPQSYFTSANVFYVTSDGTLVSVNPIMGTPEKFSINAALNKSITGMAAQAVNGKDFSYTNSKGEPVYAYMRQISQMGTTYILEVPVASVESQLQVLLRFILILLGAALLLSGVFAFVGARQIALPLVDLSEKARKFANGDFSQKAGVNRNDEIGLLASSFNYMVNQLSTFYSSLEAKVADRTEQLRTASEIALDAVSAPTTNAILQRVTESIVARLGYAYASVYLADKSNKFLILTEDHSRLNEKLPERNLRLAADSSSLIGWTAANRQARLSQNVQTERPKLLDTPLLPSARSEIALPILIADRLVGVLDIQSETQNAFDFESMPAFTTLTNQISTGLRNIELLESTQLSLQESAFIYSATRAISNAQQEEAVRAEVTNLFNRSAYAALMFDVIGNEIHLSTIGDASATPMDQTLIGTTIPFENGLKQLAENGSVIIEDFQVRSDFSPLTAYLGRRACHFGTVIPVYEGEQLLHVLAIGSREETVFTALQMQPYNNLAETIGASLEKIHLSQSLSNKETEIGFLRTTFAEANAGEDSQQVYQSIHEQIRQAFGATLGFVVAIKDETEQSSLNIPYYSVESPIKINSYPISNDLLSQIINSGESIQLEDAAGVNKFTIDSFDTHLTAKAWLGIPLRYGKNIVGAIAVFDPAQSALFSEENQQILELLASRIALDIFIRKQANNLLDLQRTYDIEKYLFDSLLINIPDRISFKNTNNEFIRISKSLAEFLGETDPKNLLGKVDEYPYQGEASENDSAALDEAISTQTPMLNHTEKWINREGEEQWVIANRIPLVAPEGIASGLLSISNDITEYVKIEQLAEHRADQLLTASEIANESTTGTMDVDETLSRVVELIKSRFNFYHASIFLIDRLGKNAVLRESTGEAGAQLKQAGHKLSVGSSSIVGQATGKGSPVVVGDVTQEANYFANPLLPETRSEMAIPMKIGDRVLGALDVQSTEYNAFSQEDINILQILANQTAVAVQNEDLFIHTMESLSRHRLLHQITSANVEGMTVEDAIRGTLEVLHQAMPDEQITYFTIDQKNVLTARASSGITNPDQTSRRIPFGRGVVGRVASELEAIQIGDAQSNPAYQPQNFETNSILAVPVKFADTLLGVLNIESTQLAQFDENDQEFVTTLAGNMGAIISNIGLLEQIREQVNRQQRLIEITSKIRRSVDIETIMQTSVSEIGNALNVRRATIQISPKFEKDIKKEQGR